MAKSTAASSNQDEDTVIGMSYSVSSNSWIVDSGASSHITHSLQVFSSYKTLQNQFVILPNNTKIPVSAIGTVHLAHDLILENVLYIPSFHVNLLSVGCLLHNSNCSVMFTGKHFLIQDIKKQKVIGKDDLIQGLYVYHTVLSSPSCSNTVALCTPVNNTATVWHNRLGHLSDHILKIVGNKIDFPFPSKSCQICPLAKFRKLPFIAHNNYTASSFDLIHCDIWGPFQTPTYDGKHYFLTLVDDCTRYTWVRLLQHKSEAPHLIKCFFTIVKTQFDKTIKAIRSDNAKELQLTSFLQDFGVVHQFSCPYRPQQNSVVERKHQHLLNVARSLLFQSKAPIKFWGECVSTAAFLINRTPSTALQDCSPFEKLHGKLPDYSALKSFGCLCFAATTPPQRSKFSPRATPCVFMGYPTGIKGMKEFSPNSSPEQFQTKDHWGS